MRRLGSPAGWLARKLAERSVRKQLERLLRANRDYTTEKDRA